MRLRRPKPGPVLLWAAAAALTSVGLLRLVGWTSSYWMIAALSLSPWLLLPVWPLGVVAVVCRRWVLGTCCAVLAFGYLWWIGPEVSPVASAPAPLGPARLRLFDANVSQANRDLDEIAGEIAADRPQLVALEELTPQALGSLQRTAVLDRFGHRVVQARGGAGGMGLWSTLPLRKVVVWANGDGQVEIGASVGLDHHLTRVNVVHVYAPLGGSGPARWQQQLGRIERHVAAGTQPEVVAGDFNATHDLPEFRAIMRDGLRDAAVLAGEGWRMTWPRDQAWVIPYLRIDHVLVSRNLTVTSYRLGRGRGSDHKPILVTLAATA